MKITRRLLREGVILVLALTGAACASVQPYKDALARIGDIGPRIADDIKPDNPGGEARKAEFLRLCDECRTLGK